VRFSQAATFHNPHTHDEDMPASFGMTLFEFATDATLRQDGAAVARTDAKSTPTRHPRRPFIGAFESTFLPHTGVDVGETTGLYRHWPEHLDRLQSAGVTRLRYALRWHHIARESGVFDWNQTDAELGAMRERGLEPIVDLVHHTSYPARLEGGFADRRFAGEYVRFSEAVARRYPWLTSYTLFNEPFATLFLAGHEALWPPYQAGMEGFVRLAKAVLPAVRTAGAIFADLLPGAEHVWIDTCEAHSGSSGGPADYAAFANDRRHLLLDLALGRNLDEERPALAAFVAAGGERLLDLAPMRVDVLGLDYYPHSEWWYSEAGSVAPSPAPLGFAALAAHYHKRYELPLLLAETNIRGLASDRATWLRYMLDQYETAEEAGVPLRGFCWFPVVDSADWDSLLAVPAGRRDPVGVYDLAPSGRCVRTEFTDAWERAALGAPRQELPAYRLQAPNDELLHGFFESVDWAWQDAPNPEPPIPVYPQAHDLVVLSHLRWDWVWQRPQHLVIRFAADRGVRGARTWFVEEPIPGGVPEAELWTEHVGQITRVRLVVPMQPGQGTRLSFDDPAAAAYAQLLCELLAEHGAPHPDVLIYTPIALDIARSLDPHRVAYDVMDDLASFAQAPPRMRERQAELLEEAHVVYAGGRSLHRGVVARRPDCHLFPSGVDVEHYAAARMLRARSSARRPVLGYVGVIDERLDLDLIGAVARALPDWTIRIVGPVAKIDPAALPAGPNVEYPGMADYSDLPAVMAGFDVAVMPFALNDATRSISPTKTLEYLAAGLPVVSTRVADVVADYSDVVCFADDAAGLAAACRRVIDDPQAERDRLVRVIQDHQSWDAIAQAMLGHLEAPAARLGSMRADPVHYAATRAAAAGLRDAALGSARLQGPLVATLAEAAVASATPFVRAPLLARLSAVEQLHPGSGDDSGRCPSCGVPAPCDTAMACA
jgi:glycosyltransferase involved in cell wall biosynthesis/beta-glucosidase/6-phospho-beta-glucosidase/beta-galactosidase